MPPAGPRRSKYLGFVAHEIKNPLATALWSCDLLKRMEGAERGGPRAEKMLDVSLRALRRMRRLVEDYFMIERLQENGYELRMERIPLKDLVAGAIEALGDKDNIKADGWALDLAQAELSGDADMLRRCLRALLEHMARPSAEPKLTLVGNATDRSCTLLIRASAPPVPLVPPVPEDRQSGDPTGSVLGFALADSIAVAHGGKVEECDGGLLLTLPAAA